MRRCAFLAPWLLFLIACANVRPEPTPTAETTSPPVAEELAQFYDEFGGSRLFGNPISEFFAPENGLRLQYFEFMRLEYHETPELSGANRITIFPLGEWALEHLDEPLDEIEFDSGPSRYFNETGYSVQGEFLAFYEAFHGEQVLGPPISALSNLNGQRVQFFRNGRLDWHPDSPADQRVQLGSLGPLHFDATMTYSYPPALSKQFVSAASVTSVDVFPSVQYPVLFRGDKQVLSVTILSPEGRSVSGLTVQIAVSHGEESEKLEMSLAEDENQIHATIDSTDIVPGEQVEILVSVMAARAEVLGTGTLTFETWW